jgi:hypothetical protein
LNGPALTASCRAGASTIAGVDGLTRSSRLVVWLSCWTVCVAAGSVAGAGCNKETLSPHTYSF